MDKSLFRYIWRHSRRDQLIILAVVLASLPFYFASLDLPRRIVNEAIQGRAFEGGRTTASFLNIGFTWPEFLGGGRVDLFGGFPVDRLGLLYGLSGVFLVFVLINGAFKYWINVSKGALGERMLRRMRFDLFSLILRFTPETLRNIKPSETATIIKDEVEPIGGFIGDAFITPAFLGTQALTALTFIIVQNVWLGLMAFGVIAVQFTIIPRLRRELLKLGKQRQLASRRLAGRVGEVVEGMEAVHVHNAHSWERAEIGNRLFELFDLRFRIYRRKFMVKFLNNLLAQMTPFLFYAVGGYFALRGTLDIGQLVAVIAAYRELPPPLKELIDWDQQRLDVQVKFDQVVQHFSPERLLPAEERAATDDLRLTGPVVAEELKVVDSHGGLILDGASFRIESPSRVALISDAAPSATALAKILGRRTVEFGGRVCVGEHDLIRLPGWVVGRRLSYAGVEPVLFPGSIRDNLIYGLRHRPLAPAEMDPREQARRIMEAKRTGNPLEHIADRWVDLELAGAKDEDDLDRILIDHLRSVGMEDDVYRFGLSGRVDPQKHPELAARVVEARSRLRETFAAQGMADLVEPFGVDRYNNQATVAENLIFGVPVEREFMGRSLAEQPGFRETLDRAGLSQDLTDMGFRIAETMVEIFRGLPPGHSLFEQFSFIGADELSDFEAMVRRKGVRARGPAKDDAVRLLSVPLAYVEPRHRLGLLTDEMRSRVVAARPLVREMLERSPKQGVEFYDPERVSPSAPLKDNLLFGRVSYTVANAQARVTEAVSAVVTEMGLREAVERIGLDHQVGPSGRLLSAQQRASVNLVRCLVKRPDLLVIDGALAPYDEKRTGQLLQLLLDMSKERTLFVVLPNDRDVDGFDAVMRFGGGQVKLETNGREPKAAAEPARETPKRVAGGVA